MKKLLLILAFAASIFTANAQDSQPTFDETVVYFNNFLKENGEIFLSKGSENGNINSMKARKDGTVIFYWKGTDDTSETIKGSFNLHDVYQYEWSGINPNGTMRLHVYFNNKKEWGNSYEFEDHITEQMANKMIKMLSHLKSLCTEKDPFD